jgi:hypothetical protein
MVTGVAVRIRGGLECSIDFFLCDMVSKARHLCQDFSDTAGEDLDGGLGSVHQIMNGNGLFSFFQKLASNDILRRHRSNSARCCRCAVTSCTIPRGLSRERSGLRAKEPFETSCHIHEVMVTPAIGLRLETVSDGVLRCWR